MQQRQLRLGDILDDYSPRERRVTNHAVVAMLGSDVKQTRCTTCDAEHAYKHAKVPRQRRKADAPDTLAASLPAASAAASPKRVSRDESQPPEPESPVEAGEEAIAGEPADIAPESADPAFAGDDEESGCNREEEGPVHRPLIRASLPRPEGQAPPARPMPEFTIRQPGGRTNRFRPRHQRGDPFGANRSNGNTGGGGPMRGGSSRQGGGGRPPQGSTPPRR